MRARRMGVSFNIPSYLLICLCSHAPWDRPAIVQLTIDNNVLPAQMMPNNFPCVVSGTISPYPTVVSVMNAHQQASGIDLNFVDDTFLSHRYNTRRNISLELATRVCFKICRPRDILKKRNKRSMRTRDSISTAGLSVKATSKYTGRMATKSTQFRIFFENTRISGQVAHLNMNSAVNQIPHIMSTTLMIVFPIVLSLILMSVLKQSDMTETTTNDSDTQTYICKRKKNEYREAIVQAVTVKM